MNGLLNELKNKNFKNVYIIYGKEEYLIEFYVNEIIKSSINSSFKDMNYDVFEDKIQSINEVKEKMDTVPFMGDKRIIHIKKCKLFDMKNKTLLGQIAQLLETIIDSSIVIIQEDNVDKRSKYYKMLKKFIYTEEVVCDKLDEKRLVRWIQKKLNDKNKKIEAKTAVQIVRRVGTDMINLYSEINKLIEYIGEREIIKIEDVNYICIESIESKIFDLLSVIANKNVEASIKIYKNLLLTKEPIQVMIHMIARQFSLVIKTKMLKELMLSKKEMAKKLEVQEFVISECMSQAQRFSYKDLKVILDKISNLDVDIKRGKVNAEIGLELFIIETARKI